MRTGRFVQRILRSGGPAGLNEAADFQPTLVSSRPGALRRVQHEHFGEALVFFDQQALDFAPVPAREVGVPLSQPGIAMQPGQRMHFPTNTCLDRSQALNALPTSLGA